MHGLDSVCINWHANKKSLKIPSTDNTRAKKKNLNTNNGHVTKHYTENKRLSNATSMKSGVGDSGAPEESAVTALLMAPVVLLLLKNVVIRYESGKKDGIPTTTN